MEPTVAEPTPPRVPLDVDVECQAHGFAPATFQSMNLSEGGIFLKSPFPLDIATPVVCTFRLPDGAPAITVQGEVAWTRTGPPEQIPPPGMGIRFSDMAPDTATRVRNHVDRMERDLLGNSTEADQSSNLTPSPVPLDEEEETGFDPAIEPPNEEIPSAGVPNAKISEAPSVLPPSPQNPQGDLLMEGDELSLEGPDGSPMTGEVTRLTPEGLRVSIPLDGIAINSPLTMVKKIPTSKDSKALILDAFIHQVEGAFYLDLDLGLRTASSHAAQKPLKKQASADILTTFPELDPPKSLCLDEMDNAHHSPSPPLPASVSSPPLESEDLYEDPSEQDDFHSSLLPAEEQAEEPFLLSSESSGRKQKKTKHSGIVDFKTRTSQGSRRKARSQMQKGSSRRHITLLGSAAAAAVVLFFVVFFSWGNDKKTNPRKKPQKVVAKQRTVKPSGVALDPNSVQIPHTSSHSSAAPPALPGKAPQQTRQQTVNKNIKTEPKWVKRPTLKKKGKRIQLTLPTKGKPNKVTYYPLAKPPGWVVDLHGVEPKIKPGRYYLKGKNARLLKVTKSKGNSRFIVYFNRAVSRNRLKVRSSGGGGSITWPAQNRTRHLSRKKRASRLSNKKKRVKRLTLAD